MRGSDRCITNEIVADKLDYGTSHTYVIRRAGDHQQVIHFQQGPIKECGVNGIQHEDLYCILIDRLAMLQQGPFPHEGNEKQIELLQQALSIDKARTAERKARGVEGLNKS